MLKRNVNILIVLIALIVFFIFPTSNNGVRYTVKQEILAWSILSTCIIIFIMLNKINPKNILYMTFTLSYMIFVTVIANTNISFEISIARIAPVLCSIFLFSVIIKEEIPFKFFEYCLHFMCITIIIWNLFTLTDTKNSIAFVIRNYTQFYDYATEGQLLRGKPVFTFGVHNVAAFFYMQIFLFCRFAYKYIKNKIFVFYMICISFFTLLLKSTTSLGFSIIMLSIMFFLTKENTKIIIFSIVAFFLGLVVFWGSPLFNTYIEILFSKTNGFIPRYFAQTTVFSNNLKIMQNNILGIGFTIPRGEYQVYFADSGYLIYFTMGNIFFLFMMFYLFYNYVRENIDIEFRKIFLMTVFLFELSMPSFIYYKGIYFYLFAASFYRSLGLEKNNYI